VQQRNTLLTVARIDKQVDLVAVVKKAKESALRGGLAGAAAMCINGAF